MNKTKPDFYGWATKANVRCSDGRVISPGAFINQNGTTVPLVWQHGHDDPENVLGHVFLEDRPEGVYGYGFFNKTPKAQHTRNSVIHRDINALSIWANQLVEHNNVVKQGRIKEVSLVLSGANPGAVIENVTVIHSDGQDYSDSEEVIIYNDAVLEHKEEETMVDYNNDFEENDLVDIYERMTDKQKAVVHAVADEDNADYEDYEDYEDDEQDFDIDPEDIIDVIMELEPPDDEDTLDAVDIVSEMSEEEQVAVGLLINNAIVTARDVTITLISEELEGQETEEEMGHMNHNVFEGNDTNADAGYLSHGDVESIVDAARRGGSLKHAVEDFALVHGIDNVGYLFPDYKNVTGAPEWDKRRSEWVGYFLGGTKKSPFSRIKTLSADITEEEARAKGYVTGSQKFDEVLTIAKRETTPTTVYKKQSLNRDDVVDITDFEVVSWIKAEMREMLDEEIARAALVGDGRHISDPDKINEQNIRPIATDDDLYTTKVYVNIADEGSTIDEVADAVIDSRRFYKGTGLPTLFTKESILGRFLNLKDGYGRRIYSSVAEVATVLRVAGIVTVESLEEYPSMIGILVNPVDYVMGATEGGAVNFFDDFDIDYNKEKYLIESRLCGALTKMKSAIVINSVTTTIVSPTAPTFNAATGVVTIPTVTGVIYKNKANDTTLNAGAQTPIDKGDVLGVYAVADTNYSLPYSEDNEWRFVGKVAL